MVGRPPLGSEERRTSLLAASSVFSSVVDRPPLGSEERRMSPQALVFTSAVDQVIASSHFDRSHPCHPHGKNDSWPLNRAAPSSTMMVQNTAASHLY